MRVRCTQWERAAESRGPARVAAPPFPASALPSARARRCSGERSSRLAVRARGPRWQELARGRRRQRPGIGPRSRTPVSTPPSAYVRARATVLVLARASLNRCKAARARANAHFNRPAAPAQQLPDKKRRPQARVQAPGEMKKAGGCWSRGRRRAEPALRRDSRDARPWTSTRTTTAPPTGLHVRHLPWAPSTPPARDPMQRRAHRGRIGGSGRRIGLKGSNEKGRLF